MKAEVRKGLAVPGGRAEGIPEGREVLNEDSVEGLSRGPDVGMTTSLDLQPGRGSGHLHHHALSRPCHPQISICAA